MSSSSSSTRSSSVSRRTIFWFGALALLLTACAGGSGNKQPQPESLPPSSSVHYAASYPQRVTATRETLGQQQTAAQSTVQTLPTLPDQLSNPRWSRVLEIVDLADADGRNEAFAERVEQTGELERFIAEHGDAFARALGKDVDRALEKELGSKQQFESRRSLRSSLNSTVQEHRKEQLTEVSDALQAVAYYADELGKGGQKTLHEQALAIALASYVVHIEVVEQRNRLEDELAQAEDVRTTLDDNLAALDQADQDPALTNAQRDFNQKRRARLQEARARLDQDVLTGKQALEQADRDIATLQDTYDKALADLRADLEERARQQDAAANP